MYRVSDFEFVYNPMNSSDQISMFQLHSDVQVTVRQLVQAGVIVKIEVNMPAMDLMIYH
jgi:transcriptional accessory protein Tex/SPT6